MRVIYLLRFAGLAVMLACGSPTTNPDAAGRDAAGRDAQTDDAAQADGSTGRDAGTRRDGGVSGDCADAPLPALMTQEVADERFDSPVFVTSAPGDFDRLFVVEKPGRIKIVRDGRILGSSFLEIGVATVDEQGLLGLAFHPNYAANGRFFVFYTPNGSGANIVAEYRRSDADPDRADPTEVRRIVDIPDREPRNHNGGMIAFGPDGYLYVGLGDEGGANDDHGTIGNGQDRTTLFGSILRLDVDNAAGNYAAPGNPFTLPDGQPQIWLYGLRNPWRFSFDRASGRPLYRRRRTRHLGRSDRRSSGSCGWRQLGVACIRRLYGF